MRLQIQVDEQLVEGFRRVGNLGIAVATASELSRLSVPLLASGEARSRSPLSSANTGSLHNGSWSLRSS